MWSGEPRTATPEAQWGGVGGEAERVPPTQKESGGPLRLPPNPLIRVEAIALHPALVDVAVVAAGHRHDGEDDDQQERRGDEDGRRRRQPEDRRALGHGRAPQSRTAVVPTVRGGAGARAGAIRAHAARDATSGGVER